MRQPEMGSLESRAEYCAQTPEYLLAELQIITDLIDELIATSSNIGSNLGSRLAADENGLLVDRSFRYMEGDRAGGWAWPLIEKSIDITYCRSKQNIIPEIYKVTLDTTVHRGLASYEPITNEFTIAYLDEERRSAVSFIQQENFAEEDYPDSITRPTTIYDQGQLFDELATFVNLLDVQSRQDALVSEAD